MAESPESENLSHQKRDSCKTSMKKKTHPKTFSGTSSLFSAEVCRF